jgi:NCS2 family nucleobase:cation symporter-2
VGSRLRVRRFGGITSVCGSWFTRCRHRLGSSLGYSAGDLAFLISADLFVAGIATIIQWIGFWRFGVRLPLMQGVTFAAVGPMIAIGQSEGIQAVFGATIACGAFMILIAPFFSQLLRFSRRS